jgi:hypothetical protein
MSFVIPLRTQTFPYYFFIVLACRSLKVRSSEELGSIVEVIGVGNSGDD